MASPEAKMEFSVETQHVPRDESAGISSRIMTMTDRASPAARASAFLWRMPPLYAAAAWIVAAAGFWFVSQLPSVVRWGLRVLFLVLVVHAAAVIVRVVLTAWSRPRRALFVGVALLLGAGIPYVCAEVLCWAWLRATQRGGDPFSLTDIQVQAAQEIIDGRTSYTTHSRELGWTITPGTVSSNGLYRSNSQGLRGDREYATAKPADTVRALCFGDSFTQCDEVKNDETWEHYAEKTGGVEFLNFGVGGYGMTQALLRYLHDGRKFETDVVILGCMTADVRRTVNAYYPFRLDNPSEAPNVRGLPYPTLDETGKLVLHPNPLPDAAAYRELLAHPARRLRELSRLDILYHQPPPTPLLTLIKSKAGDRLEAAWLDFTVHVRRSLNTVLKRSQRVEKIAPVGEDRVFDPRHPIFTINCRVFDRFVDEVRAAGARPLILWLPGRDDFPRLRAGREKIYQGFLDYFKSRGYDWIDAMEWITAELPGEGGVAPNKTLLVESHYSAATNRAIGKHIAAYVKKMAGK